MQPTAQRYSHSLFRNAGTLLSSNTSVAVPVRRGGFTVSLSPRRSQQQPCQQRHPRQEFRAYDRRRHFTSGMSIAAAAAAPKFSPGSDDAALALKLRSLLKPGQVVGSGGESAASSTDGAAGQRGRWVLIPSGEGIERSFKFKTFAKTWDFMTAVALQCKLKNHHPEWSNVYNTTFVRWTTHSPQGLSALDIDLAALCDSLAKDFGEIVEDVEGADNASCNVGRQLADTVATSAGDCCVPKPKASGSP